MVTESLKGKRVLITAGPTWVPVDNTRVISNIATGETGILLAKELQKLGAKVTLLLGPVNSCCLNKKIRLLHFKFFAELKDFVTKELKARKYDLLVHSAAVADYQPSVVKREKIKSGKKVLRLNLIPTQKIIDLMRKASPYSFLVGFKFEPGVNKKMLLKRANILLCRSDLDLVVANNICKNRYQAYIVNKHKAFGPFQSKRILITNLTKAIIGF